MIDSQSVKTTEVGGTKGFDAGKKVKGRKRHIVVDRMGLLLAVVVHSAGVQDCRGAELVLEDIEKSYPNLKVVWADGGYQRDCLLKWVKERGVGWRLEVVQRPPGTKGFVVQSCASGGGADVRLARAVSAAEQGLRTSDGDERGVDPIGDDSYYGPKVGAGVPKPSGFPSRQPGRCPSRLNSQLRSERLGQQFFDLNLLVPALQLTNVLEIFRSLTVDPTSPSVRQPGEKPLETPLHRSGGQSGQASR